MDIGVYGARGVPSTYGGYETFLTSMLPRLVAAGHEVTVYCRREDGGTDEGRSGHGDGGGDEGAAAASGGSLWAGVNRRYLPSVAGKNFNTLSHGLLAAVAARRAGHDVVLVFNVANAFFCGVGRWTGQPVVLNTDGQEWLRGKWGKTGRRVFLTAASWSRRSANALVADSAAMAAIYRDQFGSTTTVIPYCVPSASALDPGPRGVGAATRELGLEPGRFVLIAGRHNPENNLVSVANEFLESTCPLPLVVLGTANYDSPVTQELERLAAMDPRLRLLGHVGDRSVYFDLLASASIYVHGHSVGGTNPGLIEAMACGARVVALDNAFNRETLGGVGRFFTLDGSSFAGLVTDCVNETTASERSYRDLLQVVAGDRYSLDAIVAAYAEVASAARRSGRRGGVRIRTRWENTPAAAPVLIDLRRSDAAMDEATQPVTKG